MVQLSDSNGNFIGYISKTYYDSTTQVITTDPAQALQVALVNPVPNPSNGISQYALQALVSPPIACNRMITHFSMLQNTANSVIGATYPYVGLTSYVTTGQGPSPPVMSSYFLLAPLHGKFIFKLAMLSGFTLVCHSGDNNGDGGPQTEGTPSDSTSTTGLHYTESVVW